jgi:hypothetical protein
MLRWLLLLYLHTGPGIRVLQLVRRLRMHLLEVLARTVLPR